MIVRLLILCSLTVALCQGCARMVPPGETDSSTNTTEMPDVRARVFVEDPKANGLKISNHNRRMCKNGYKYIFEDNQDANPGTSKEVKLECSNPICLCTMDGCWQTETEENEDHIVNLANFCQQGTCKIMAKLPGKAYNLTALTGDMDFIGADQTQFVNVPIRLKDGKVIMVEKPVVQEWGSGVYLSDVVKVGCRNCTEFEEAEEMECNTETRKSE
ncbi:hypothetical protein QR680_010687 [Steinernema hermaphroditum]|uniref:Uncharacterized protein n=1 Tax=Steinernema hermaphroditum TaxID=289476 RepID=A0AA39IS76_9BILA|nr:hypothetical protein QR680_010687 [Steinernema hermaphroditum]